MKTFYSYLQENDPELNQLLINFGIRERITNHAEIFANEKAMVEIKKFAENILNKEK